MRLVPNCVWCDDVLPGIYGDDRHDNSGPIALGTSPLRSCRRWCTSDNGAAGRLVDKMFLPRVEGNLTCRVGLTKFHQELVGLVVRKSALVSGRRIGIILAENMPPRDEQPTDDDVTAFSQSTTIARSETSSLLGKSVDEEAGEHGYGTVEPDPERAPAVVSGAGDERRFSNAFIARTVVALLVGESQSRFLPSKAMALIKSCALSGAFTANADGSLVMATHPVIGSEFNDLENSSWLFIGFMLAGCATQSVVSSENGWMQINLLT